MRRGIRSVSAPSRASAGCCDPDLRRRDDERPVKIRRLLRAVAIAGIAVALAMPPTADEAAWAQSSHRSGHAKGHRHKGSKRHHARVAANPALREQWDQCNDDDAEISIQGCTAIIQAPGETPPNKGVALFNRGTSYMGIEQYASAVQDYTDALSRNPNDAETFNNRGEAWRAMGQKERADSDFRRARELDPNLPEP